MLRRCLAVIHRNQRRQSTDTSTSKQSAHFSHQREKEDVQAGDETTGTHLDDRSLRGGLHDAADGEDAAEEED